MPVVVGKEREGLDCTTGGLRRWLGMGRGCRHLLQLLKGPTEALVRAVDVGGDDPVLLLLLLTVISFFLCFIWWIPKP